MNMNRIAKLIVVGVSATAMLVALVPLSAVGQGVGEPARMVRLEGASGFDDAKGTVVVFINTDSASDAPQFDALASLRIDISQLPCRGIFRVGGPLSDVSRQFYALYMTMPSTGRFRVLSFNTHCVAESHSSDPFLPLDLRDELSTEDITVEVFLEVDDAKDGPDTATPILVLSGSTN